MIQQIDVTPIKYDKQYVSHHDDLSDQTIKLGYQRLGWLLSRVRCRSPSGDWLCTCAFLEAAKIMGLRAPLLPCCRRAQLAAPRSLTASS